MPNTQTAPGVYLRGAETPPAPPGSAITGIVGVAERGPLNSPQPLTGWNDYADTFGGFVAFGHLAESVFGFFRNGGEKCWAVRVADTRRAGATPPAGQCAQELPLATASAVLTDHNGLATLRLSALDAGGWGNRLAVRVSTSNVPSMRIGTLTQPTTPLSPQVFVDSIIDLRPGGVIRITQPDGVTGAVDRAIAAGGSALDLGLGRVTLDTAVGRAFPIGSVVYAAGFRIEAEFRGRREVFEPLSMATTHPRYFASVVNAPETMVDYGERRRRGFSSLIRAEHVFGAGGVSRFRPADRVATAPLGGGGDGFTQARGMFLDASSAPLVTIVAKQDRGSAGNGLEVVAVPFRTRLALPLPGASGARNRLVVDDIRGFRVGEPVQVGDSADPTSETATPSRISSADMMLELAADVANPHKVGEPVTVADRFSFEARRAGTREPIEVVRNLSGNPMAGPRFVRTALAAESALLCASMPPVPFPTPVPAGSASASITLAGGADPGAIDARYYTGYEPDGSYFHPAELAPGSLVGLATLEAIDEIGLVTIPDVVRVSTATLVAAQTSILRHCARLGDRFALLDAPAFGTPTAPGGPVSATPALTIEEWAAALGDADLRRYGAALYPWVWGTYDDIDQVTPPSGLVAGLIARTDAERGVSNAPANGRLRGTFALEPPVDRRLHGELNSLGVNCVVKLDDAEIRLMGSRTLSAAPAARYINVRRTVLSVKKTLARRMLWAAFEPLGGTLFPRLEATLVTLLQALLARGVTASQRPAEAFYVRCNAETNPPEQQRLGIVVAEVGIALLAPAEFLVLTVRRTPDTVHVIEEVA